MSVSMRGEAAAPTRRERQRRETLAEIKARAGFADSPLVRQGRLSVVPLTVAQYGWLVGE